jgi:photosystem II stability/assembly factor-like uncharacterized protein
LNIVLVIVASTKGSLSVLTPSPPSAPRPDESSDVEALEALIEEARRRTRRRRRWYGTCALVAAAAALIGYFGFGGGGGGTPSKVANEGRSPEAGLPAQGGAGDLAAAAGLKRSYIRTLAVNPLRPRIVFAATLDAGVFKSTDGGASWQSLTLPSTVTRADAVAIAAAEPRIIYAGTGRGVFKTTDGGATWQAANGGLFGAETTAEREHRMLEGYVYSLVVDPRDAETVYAGTWERGLLKTTNGGASWQRLAPGWVDGGLVLDPNDPETIYVGAIATATRTDEGGVSKSTDGGRTWQPAGLQGKGVGALAIDQQHPETLYAGTSRGAYKSSDGGNSWHRLNLQGSIAALTLDPTAPTTVYADVDADADAALFKSTNGGRTWKALKVGPVGRIGSFTLALAPSSATLYSATAAGVLRSTDGGRSWDVSTAD